VTATVAGDGGQATTSDEAAVRTSGLTKRYGEVVALDDLTVAVPRGVVFGLLGPNGAGKTTTIRLLAGLARPTGGAAWIGGRPVGGPGSPTAARIGYLDQDPRFYGWMRGRELVELVGRLHGLDGGELRRGAGEALERAGLGDAAERRIGGYSGGMRQRLGIAQALIHRPELLILDEPASSLDPEGRRDVLELIGDLRGESTVICSTHVLADVERVADRVAILDRGRLVTEGSLGELLDRYAQPVFRLDPEPGQASAVDALVAGLRRAPWLASLDMDGGVVRVSSTDPETASVAILAEVVATRVRLASFERQRPTLEDVFLRLVGRREAPTGDRPGPGRERAPLPQGWEPPR
jgi:ABC-2 type transport system ATP-binding protein